MNVHYRKALDHCLHQLDACETPRGMESIIQRSLAKLLPGSRTEVPLPEVGAVKVNGETAGRMDIVHEGHGIEIKVVRMPRLGATGSNALYDVGQLTADYWRLWKAKKLTSGELLILVYGSLVTELKTGSAVCRELHNRLFVDFQTSIQYFELREQASRLDRKRQIATAKIIGVDQPCSRPGWKAYVNRKYGLVSVAVARVKRREM